MVNQLGKFVLGLADINAPLPQLLRKDSVWYWDEAQRTAFQRVKEKLASSEILAHYNPNRQTVIAADASSTGLEAVLLYKIMDSAVLYVRSTDPSMILKGTMRSLRRRRSPQPGHADALKSTSLESGFPWKQITSHLFHSSQQPTCPRCPLEYCPSASK